MFSAKEKSSNVQYDTVISAKTEITGDVRFSGGVNIDGVIKGNLTADGSGSAVLRVSNKGRVEGDIHAPNIIINGEINGNIYASEYIELAKDARITGDVHYKAMEMVMGASVNGQLKHQADGKAAKAAKGKPVQTVSESKVD